MNTSYLLEVAVSVALIATAIGFAVGLAIGRGRQPRWQEKGSFVHKVSIGFATLDRLDAVLLRFEVEPASRLSGVEVGELRLPPGSSVAILARGKAGEPISFWGFTRYGVVVTVVTLLVAWAYVYLRYFAWA